MNLTQLQNLLWFASCCLNILLAGTLYYKRLQRTIPMFCIWMLVNSFVSPLLFLVSRHGNGYLYAVVYYVSGITDAALQIGVIIDFARQSLRDQNGWTPGARGGLIAAAVIAIAISTVLTYKPQAGAETSSDLLFVRVSLFVTMLILILAIATLFLSYENGHLWKKPLMSLFGGFLAWSISSGVTDTLHILRNTSGAFDLIEIARAGSTILVTAFWLIAAIAKNRQQLYDSREELRTFLMFND